MQNDQQLLTVEEARTDPEIFNSKISRNAFYEVLKRGEFPHIRVGGRIFISRAQAKAKLHGDAV